MNYKIKVPKITDKTYYTLSQESYNRERLADKMKTGKPIQTDQKTYWYVEKIKTDEDTGLDAVVLSQGEKTQDGNWTKSKNPENVVVAFAGTDIGKDPINDGVKADGGNIVFGNNPKKEVYYIVKKDAEDTSKTLGKYNGTPSQDAMLTTGKYKLITKTSQIDQADQLVRSVKKKYAGTSTIISTTGHSLGGAEAEYSAVNNDVYAVAFNSPSVVKLHDEETQKDINSGIYDPYIRSIINPDDMVGAGYWNEYDRHNGTTIYTKNPSLSQFSRKQRLDGNLNEQISKNLAYFFTTVILRNPDTHGLNEANFVFDRNGTIANPNGDELVFDKNLGALLPAGAIGSGDAIKVTPTNAKKLAEKVQAMTEDLRTMKKEAQNAYQEHDEKIAELKTEFYGQVGHGLFDQLQSQDVTNTIEDIALSYEKGPIFYDTQAEQAFIDSLQAAITDLEEIGGFLHKIADEFQEKDQMLANWLR
ncbi:MULTISPECIES: lipase [Bacillus amyloliquefaciens group]|uniref:lipase n=1 Tax=Bacillus amyloliquefaciens group TaxID=1938374 RepID=UPI00136411BB|nr:MULTISPECIES: lipase [Bacillus amyloliquefaciens group]MBO3651843.1 lipase [Bacillus amyloliquefaciens]MCJ2174741.1 lipase [Bacillus amyloliquefaciens]MCR4352005.1 lipase [Bacillus amyloliquefaciens]MCR4358873.1 lipase [Bacillus amyloliquefaciens]MDX7982293.1 lipase [Bacillus velezensis]